MFGFSKEVKKKAHKMVKNVKKTVDTSKKLGKAFKETAREDYYHYKNRTKKVVSPAKRAVDYVNKKMWGEL